MNGVLMKPEMDKLTEKIIGCAYIVSNTLGAGLSRKFMKMLLRTNYKRPVSAFTNSIQSKYSMMELLLASFSLICLLKVRF